MDPWIPFTPSELIWPVLCAAALLCLPGAAILVWRPGKGNWAERLADAVGISISLAALAGLAGHLLEIEFSGAAVTGIYAACLLAWTVGLILRTGPENVASGRSKLLAAAGVALGVAAVLGAIVWRWYQARELLLPAWVDSVHHTLIVEQILANQGVPADFGGVIQAPLAYHYGFHLMAALFSAMTGFSPADSVLWFGQLLNALIGLSVYRLGVSLWGRDAWPQALLAGGLVTFAFQMPAYYVTWGRYTLSAGLVLLPLAMAAALRLSKYPRFSTFLMLALLTAGVALTHLTALLLLGFFMAVLLAGRLLARPRGKPGGLVGPAAASLLGLGMAAPWLVFLWQTYAAQASLRVVSPVGGGQAGYWEYILYLLGPLHSQVLLAAAGVGLLWFLVRPGTRIFATWGLLLGLMTLPWGLRLGPFRPDHFAILLFLPASLLLAGAWWDLFALAGRAIVRLAGGGGKTGKHSEGEYLEGVGEEVEREEGKTEEGKTEEGKHAGLPQRGLPQRGLPQRGLPQRIGLVGIYLVAALGSIGVLAWGAWETRDVINPATVFVEQADLPAMEWVEENTPQDARFFINTTQWMSGVFRGVDGGYWLTVLNERESILPPSLYTLGEPEYRDQITAWAERASRLTGCGDDFWSLVEEADLQYLYLREGAGSLQPSGLDNCQGLLAVYRRDGVWIYEVIRDSADPGPVDRESVDDGSGDEGSVDEGSDDEGLGEGYPGY